MSTSPYSIDLRKKVIEFIESGNTQKEASRVFKLNPNTVSSWCIRYKKEGHYLPRKRPGARAKIEKEKFSVYLKNNPNATSAEIGKVFNLSASRARYWLKKLNFTYKKKTLATWKQ